LGILLILIINYLKQHIFYASHVYNRVIILMNESNIQSEAKNLKLFPLSTMRKGSESNTLKDIPEPAKQNIAKKETFFITEDLKLKNTFIEKSNNIAIEKETKILTFLKTNKKLKKSKFKTFYLFQTLCFGTCIKSKKIQFNILMEMIKKNFKKMD